MFAKAFSFRSLFLVCGLLAALVWPHFNLGFAVDPPAPVPQQNSGTPNDTSKNFFLQGYETKPVNLNGGEFDIHPTDIDEFEEFGPRFIRIMSGIVVLIAILVFMIGAGFWIFSAG